MNTWIGGQIISGSMKGSLGMGFVTTSGKHLFLTNAHVTAGFASRSIGRVIKDDAKVKNIVGTVYRTIKLKGGINHVDASICIPHGQLENFSIMTSFGDKIKVSGQQEIDLSQKDGYFYLSNGVKKDCSSPRSGPRERILFELENPSSNGFFEGHYIFQIANANLTVEHGDSGSVLLKPSASGFLACGIIFAGKRNKKEVYVQSFSKFMKALEGREASLFGASSEDLSIAWPK